MSQLICPGWPQITVLPTSASQVAKIIGVKPLVPSFSYKGLLFFFRGSERVRDLPEDTEQ
jgi:hypothetical protein